MSNETAFRDDSDDKAPPETIEERIERGRQTGRVFDGGIVPFPESVKPSQVCNVLKGNPRQRTDELIAHGYKPTAYAYHSMFGEIIQIVLRFDHEFEKKEIRPLRFLGEFPDKGRVYDLSAIEGIRPLYNLHLLAQHLEAPVLVVEGERAADAATALFPDHVVTTWMSGAYNVKRAEMLAMSNRTIILWPDNDPPGRMAMRMFAARAYEAGATSVKIVDVPKEFGEGWDLADDLPNDLASENSLADMVASARLIDPSDVASLLKDRKARAEQRRLLGHPVGYSKVDKEAAATALSVLDPDMYGGRWRRVARCLFHAFGAEGLDMFDSWSKGSTDKYRKGEPAKLWAAYSAETHFRADSIAWLFREGGFKLAARREAEDGAEPNVELDKKAMLIAAIEELNENHAVVMRGGKTAVLREHYDPRFERYVEIYFSKKDFTEQYIRPIALVGDDDDNAEGDSKKKKGNKSKQQGELWFSSPSRRQFNGVYFTPGKTLPKTDLNLWRGFTVEAKDDPSGWSRLKEHILDNIANGDQTGYAYILNWMAFAVQRLDEPLGVALVLIGLKGSGKSMLVQLFGYLFGQHTFITSRMEDAVGRFNDRLETTLLLGLEEAVAPQNKAADGTLKDLITRPTLRLEGKFFSVWDAPNHLRIIVTSNNERVVRADASERRYAVFEVTNPHQYDPRARRAYFGRIVEQMETGGYEAMLGELLSLDIATFNREIIPETEALRRQKLLNLTNDPVRYYLYERLTDGINITTGGPERAAPIHLWSETDIVLVPVRDLSEDFLAFVKSHSLSFSERSLQLQLPRYMQDGFKSQVMRPKDGDTNSGSYRAYPFPPLEEARTTFEAKTGLTIDRDPVESAKPPETA